MSSIQKFFMRILPRAWAEDMQAQSQRWILRCTCGHERSIWEAGGIRWKARGNPRRWITCPPVRQKNLALAPLQGMTPPPASPFAFNPDQPIHTLGHFLGTPLAVQGWSWLPLSEIITWAFFILRSAQKRPRWHWHQHLLLGGARMAVSLGAEWCHNLAHVTAAHLVGKPVDALRILFGMPVLLYDEPEHPSITPRQHLIRSLGGPACNAVLLLVSKVFQHLTPPASPAREVADTAAGMNTFIAAAGLIPISAFDGGPILKWSLVGRGHSPAQAGQIVARASQLVGAGLLGSAAVALHKRRWPLAGIIAFLGMITLTAPKMEHDACRRKQVFART